MQSHGNSAVMTSQNKTKNITVSLPTSKSSEDSRLARWQLNATRSIAAGKKILDRAVKSIRCRFPGDFSSVRFHV